jgi:sigma-B regulation protein RsbU (phosphoserine phosphatase)
MNPTAQTSAPLNLEDLLVEIAEVVNSTLDLDDLLKRTAEQVRRVIDYEIFSILLLNEKTQELRIRFAIGHPPEIAERIRIKLGEGVTGLAAQQREAILVNDVTKSSLYIEDITGVRSELAVPLIIKNRVIGVIDIEARQAGYFTEEHKRFLTLVASRVAVAIENARLYTRLSRQAKQLTVLNEISRELTSILHLDALLQRIAELLTRLIDYQMFSIMLLDSTKTKLEHRFSVRFQKSVQLKDVVPLGQGLVGYAAQHKTALVVPDVSKDRRYIQLNPETRSEMVVPLIYKDEAIGVLDLEHTRRGYFTDDHRKTLTTLAAQIAIAIENARLYEHIARQEQRLEREMTMARELQFRMLPQSLPILKGAELAARFNPAQVIGGDIYEFIPYTGGRTAIAIGDVSGKGAPAALYAALVGGILRSSATGEPSAAEMLALVNTSLVERPIDAQFVSMIYAIWDDDERTLQVSNSGLPRPIICHGAKPEIVEATGLPLGFFETAEYEEFWLATEPGDVCIFFSDGIIDARNRNGDGFGRERIHEIVAANCGLDAGRILDAIFNAVFEHAEGVATFDDQTVVVLKVKERRSGSRPAAKADR